MALPGYPKAAASNKMPFEFTSECLCCCDVQNCRILGEALVKRHNFSSRKGSSQAASLPLGAGIPISMLLAASHHLPLMEKSTPEDCSHAATPTALSWRWKNGSRERSNEWEEGGSISQQVPNSTLMRFFTEILHKKRIILRQLDHLKELKVSMTFGFFFFFYSWLLGEM